MNSLVARARRLPRLYAPTLRWRSSLTLVIFMLCGAIWHQHLLAITPQIVMGGLALASQYAALVTLNDLADQAIDRLNLRGFRDRPLVSSDASRRELQVVAGAAAAVSIGVGWLASPLIGALLLVSLVLYAEYSLPPLQVSHRTWLAAPYLALGYVLVPYLVGVVASGARLGAQDACILPALVLLFLSRSLLKDLRDRWGDAAHGKRTLVLVHGKSTVCRLSIASLAAGMTLLAVALFPAHPWAALAVLPFAAGLGAFQARLLATGMLRDEVLIVLLVARISNGMLVTVLGLLLAQQAGAGVAVMAAVLVVTAAGYARVAVQYLREPGRFHLSDEQGLRPALCSVNPEAPSHGQAAATSPGATAPFSEVSRHALVA
jgi:1,4-dihydroxy-2-naphthoate octaprenyltransferase/chlorophyll synthase